jgi:hypothetical protein
VDPRLDQLAERTEETAALLARYGVQAWADWLAEDAVRIRQCDFSGVEHLLSAYGGMGSLNDVWICPENGHSIASADVLAVNEALGRLRSQLYSLASTLRREELRADGSVSKRDDR